MTRAHADGSSPERVPGSRHAQGSGRDWTRFRLRATRFASESARAMRAVMRVPLAPKDETDLPKRRLRLGEDAHAAGAVTHVIGCVVLGDELDLAELGVRRQQARTDLVDEMLDRATVELVEDALDLVTDGAWCEKSGTFGHTIGQIAVTPVNVHADREWAIGEVRKRGVVVPRERGEGAPRRLDESHPLPAASRGGDLGLAIPSVNADLRDRAIRAGRAEEDVARAALARGRVERNLARGHPKCLH